MYFALGRSTLRLAQNGGQLPKFGAMQAVREEIASGLTTAPGKRSLAWKSLHLTWYSKEAEHGSSDRTLAPDPAISHYCLRREFHHAHASALPSQRLPT